MAKRQQTFQRAARKRKALRVRKAANERAEQSREKSRAVPRKR